MNFLEQYLEKKNLLKELNILMRRLNIPDWKFKELPTLQSKDHASAKSHKIMMRYAAVFRYGIFNQEYKFEEGL